MPFEVTVLTLFPEAFEALAHSVLKRALEKGLWRINVLQIRDFSHLRHKQCDDAPFGGGPGMVLRFDVLHKALSFVLEDPKKQKLPLVFLTPHGKTFHQKKAQELAQGDGLILLCGHYEGVDARILEAFPFEEISMGDFVTTGGESASIPFLDATLRLLPGVVGKEESLLEESFQEGQGGLGGLLEHPHYTRPQTYKGLTVPPVLISGDHQAIAAWRKKASLELTRKKRPDLL